MEHNEGHYGVRNASTMNGLSFTNAEGKADFLYEDELQAVEITGRSTWQDYRRYPTTWPQQHVQVLSLMERRPGAVEPGKRPASVKSKR